MIATLVERQRPDLGPGCAQHVVTCQHGDTFGLVFPPRRERVPFVNGRIVLLWKHLQVGCHCSLPLLAELGIGVA